MSSVIRMTGLASGLDTESIVAALVSAQSLKITKVENKKTLLSWKEETLDDLNTKLYDFYTNFVSNMRLTASYNTKKVTSSDSDVIEATATSKAATGTYKIAVNQLASAQYVTSGCITKTSSNSTATDTDGSEITESTLLTKLKGSDDATSAISSGDTITIGGKTLTVTDTTTINDLVTTATSAGLNASYDSTTGRLFISSKTSGEDNSFTISATDTDSSGSETEILAALGLDKISADSSTGAITQTGSNSTLVKAQDSEVVYNGATLNYSSNEFTLNGVTVTLKDESEGDTISLSVTNDTDATYDMVKDFITQYNSIIEEFNDYYYADSASDYEPLTDDEKDSMSDDEIEKWETKIKEANLRRDTSLGSILTAMKSSMQTRVTVNGTNYSLASYGITTSSDYTEKGLLHIYGDEDDSTYSDEDDKLLAALEDDPDTVIAVLTGVAKDLYTTITDKTSSIANVRSAYTFYNDKLLTNQLDDYEDDIDDLEDKLSDMEDRYYEQFSAMETALAKLQSQSSALSSLFS